MDAGLSTILLMSGIAQGVTSVGGLYASRQQSKVDRASLDYEMAQAELAAADASYQNTRSYRRLLENQIAAGSIRGGPGGSALVQFTSETFANYAMDQKAIARKAAQIPIAGQIARANLQSDRMMRDLGLVGNLFSSAFSGVNFNSLGASLGKSPGASSMAGGSRRRQGGGMY
jgi:hypothetical protein